VAILPIIITSSGRGVSLPSSRQTQILDLERVIVYRKSDGASLASPDHLELYLRND
jgi:hypothetical protein